MEIRLKSCIVGSNFIKIRSFAGCKWCQVLHFCELKAHLFHDSLKLLKIHTSRSILIEVFESFLGLLFVCWWSLSLTTALSLLFMVMIVKGMPKMLREKCSKWWEEIRFLFCWNVKVITTLHPLPHLPHKWELEGNFHWNLGGTFFWRGSSSYCCSGTTSASGHWLTSAHVNVSKNVSRRELLIEA